MNDQKPNETAGRPDDASRHDDAAAAARERARERAGDDGAPRESGTTRSEPRA